MSYRYHEGYAWGFVLNAEAVGKIGLASHLAKAVDIASSAHKDQKDRAGAPYILHPLRLMTKAVGVLEKTVAVLHDVIEDTTVTFDELEQEGFCREVLIALDLLTHRKNVSYSAYVDRIMENRLALRVKMLDWEDNLNVLRLDRLCEADYTRISKYHTYYKKAERVLPSLENKTHM